MSQPSRLAPLIVMEGIDGAGKGTQADRLTKRLTAAGFRARLLSFPRYQHTFFGARIGEFLDGRYGSLAELHPLLISLLYAGDRFESRSTLEELRRTADMVILDRYVPSNIAHQTAKLDEPERTRLREWIEQIEYDIFGLPRPDRVVLLDVPVEVSQDLIRRKSQRAYTDQTADLQEADTFYLQRVRDVYRALADQQPNWSVISVANAGGVRALDEIGEDIWRVVEPYLKRRA